MRSALILAATTLLLAVPANGQLMNPRKQAALVRMLPRLEDRQFDAVLHNRRMLWYTNAEIPAAFQHAIGNGYVDTTFHYVFHNFSGDDDERIFDVDARGMMGGGNANQEFPWNVAPGGSHNAVGVNSYKGLLLPLDANGRMLPVVYFRQDLPARGGNERIVRGGGVLPTGRINGMNRGWGWVFPVDSILVEVLTMRDSRKYDHPFAVRFRIREHNAWGVEIFRPFATHDQLVKAMESLPGPNKTRTAAIKSLRGYTTVSMERLIDRRHRKQITFDVTAGIAPLPEISEPDVLALIDRPFVSCLGAKWRGEAIAPSNRTGKFNIVPPNHFAAFAGNERESCMRCHETVNFHATAFEQPRGWYGRVRGSDGIFSFHPIELSSISADGTPRRVVIRSALLNAGIVSRYDADKHDSETYHQIKGLY